MSVDPEEVRQSKRKAFEDLLQVSRIYLTLDTRVPGVKVPSEHQGKASLTLLFGLDLPLALGDLYVDDTKIAVTLSFERRQHHCVIPWDAVWYIVPQGERQGIIFEPSLPPEARRQIFKEGGELQPLDLGSYLEDKTTSKLEDKTTSKKVTEESSSEQKRRRLDFQVIDGDASATLTTEERNDDEKSLPPRRPILTLVKTEDDEEEED